MMGLVPVWWHSFGGRLVQDSHPPKTFPEEVFHQPPEKHPPSPKRTPTTPRLLRISLKYCIHTYSPFDFEAWPSPIHGQNWYTSPWLGRRSCAQENRRNVYQQLSTIQLELRKTRMLASLKHMKESLSLSKMT